TLEVRTSTLDPSSPVLRPGYARTVLDLPRLEGWIRTPDAAFRAAFLDDGSAVELVWETVGPLIADALHRSGVPALWRVPTDPSAAAGAAPPVLWIFTSDDLAASGRVLPSFWCGVTVQQDAASANRPRLNV